MSGPEEISIWSWLRSAFAIWFGGVSGQKFADTMSQDHHDDPTYKKNVEDLIARNKIFDKTGE